MFKKGFLIVFEGIDASGKTLHLKTISDELRKQGYNVLSTKEPTNNIIGNFIHRYSRQQRLHLLPETEALLFTADRFEHIKKTIEPALRQGRIVISDRSFYSTMAYQGAFGADIDWIRKINWFAPKPDLCILFDILPDYSLHRINRRRTIFEDVENLRRVRDVYLKLVEAGELVTVNADRPRRVVQEELLAMVKALIGVS